MNLEYSQSYSNSWALIVGINKYIYANPLEYATSDAKEVAKLLESRFQFPKENITLLLNEQANFSAIRKNFLDYVNKTKTNDRLFVFFAGHGHTLSGRRGEIGCLIPYDGDVSNIDTVIRWDDFTRGADLIPAKHTFFVMDACYSGLALSRGFPQGMRFLNDMLRRPSRQVLTAGKADQLVADGGGIRPNHSLFTAHLLNGLEGAAATEDGFITANGVMAYVYTKVSSDPDSYQTPHYGFIDGDGDFIFNLSIRETVLANEASSDVSTQSRAEKVTENDILIKSSQQIIDVVSQDIGIVNVLKQLLSDPNKMIALEDFVIKHIKVFLAATDLRNFPLQAVGAQPVDFINRLKEYEELIKDIQLIMIFLAKWANKDQLYLLEKVLTDLADADKGSAGITLWISLTWYPLHLILYSAGIAALSSKNFDALKIIYTTAVRDPLDGKTTPLVIPAMSEVHELSEWFKLIPEYKDKYVPRSEYLFKLLQPLIEDSLSLGKRYESYFDNFEVLTGLVFGDLSRQDWGPIGRFGWKNNKDWHREGTLSTFVSWIQKEGEQSAMLQSGLFNGSLDQFTKQAEVYSARLSKLSWF